MDKLRLHEIETLFVNRMTKLLQVMQKEVVFDSVSKLHMNGWVIGVEVNISILFPISLGFSSSPSCYFAKHCLVSLPLSSSPILPKCWLANGDPEKENDVTDEKERN